MNKETNKFDFTKTKTEGETMMHMLYLVMESKVLDMRKESKCFDYTITKSTVKTF
jgi:hypothetical protein